MKLSSYLSHSRHGIYYFRWPLPALHGYSKASIRISLKTRCPKQAGDLALHLASCGRIIRDNKSLAGLRQDEIRQKVQAYFKAQLEQYIDWLDRRVLSKSALADAREEMLDHDCMVELEAVNTQFLPIARFKRKMDVSDEIWNESQPRLTIELRKGRRDMLRRVLEAAERLDGYSYTNAPARAPSPLTPPTDESAPLGLAIKDFIDENSRQWAGKTTKQNQAYLSILLEYFGPERLLGTITKQDAGDVKKVLFALPSSRNTKPALKGLPLMQVIKMEGVKTISPKTIKSHIQMFRSFFVWAEQNGQATQKLFDGMKVAKAKHSETEVKPYTQTQTRMIFDALSENPSSLVRNESHKWGILLGMITGARLNEICQLDIADIQHEGEIWFLNITDDGDNNKRLKADASRRKVPLHSKLIQLGFLEFVKSRRNGQRLFPDYSYNENFGYGRNLGRWYNGRFLPKLGIKKPGIVFHSLRHTLVTRLGQANVPEPIYQCVVGHARAGVTQQVYLREGYTLVQLNEAIEKYEV